jgi:hypothetical protein
MIPIFQGDTIQIEVDGITFQTKPITGDNEIEYTKIGSLYSGAESLEDKWEIMDKLFDFIVKDWSGKGICEFPTDKRASKFLRTSVKKEVIEKAYEINGMTKEESKN